MASLNVCGVRSNEYYSSYNLLAIKINYFWLFTN
jgi:hypothetical protein